jgi:hypothetical protein
MQVNPDNVPRFKDVAQFLAEDLKRLGANPAPDAPKDGPPSPDPVECP